MNETAIVMLSDPKAGAEEAPGRVFNALAAAYDFKNEGEDVRILFQGTGTRWPEHPVNAFFLAVKDKVEGVYSGCAAVFGADASGYDLVADNQVPGTAGLPGFSRLETTDTMC